MFLNVRPQKVEFNRPVYGLIVLIGADKAQTFVYFYLYDI